MKRGLVLGTLVVVGALSAALGAASQAGGARQGGAPGAARGAQQPPSAAGLQADKLRDNLYIVRGAQGAPFSGGNTAVFITAGGVVIVDTKVPGWGQPLIDKVKELTDKPITTVINTHTHFDHAGGNPEFPATVDIVTHENTARLMNEANPVSGLQTGPQPNIYKEAGGRGLPKRTFKDRMTIGSGNDRVELHYFGRAHTSGDTFVVFPAARVLHTGDAFPNKGNPIMDANNGGSGLDYADTIGKAAALPNIDTVITGHANGTMTMADVREYSEYIREFVNAVRAAKKAGQTVDRATEWKVPERFLKNGYTQPMPMALRSNAQVIWDELK